jgi:hypothetical protein
MLGWVQLIQVTKIGVQQLTIYQMEINDLFLKPKFNPPRMPWRVSIYIDFSK